MLKDSGPLRGDAVGGLLAEFHDVAVGVFHPAASVPDVPAIPALPAKFRDVTDYVAEVGHEA